jgi:hypothetical protein
MDTVTYPNDSVKLELANWLLIKVDIAEHREVADVLEVVGIPVAVAVAADGTELGRIEGFAEPGEFQMQLEGLRKSARH